MKKLKVMTVVGTRPEIIRLSSVINKLNNTESIEHVLVHTGQNYDYELNEVIDNWLSDNCVNHRFNKSDGTETTLIYDQVRIPLYKENGQAMDTYSFARNMARFFKAAPYNIPIKTVNKGLGKCELIFGEK